MRYLSDKEILDWNKRLDGKDLDYMITPRYFNSNNNPSLSFCRIDKGVLGVRSISMNTISMDECTDPMVAMDYTFSVLSDRCDDFVEVLTMFKKEGVLNKVNYKKAGYEAKITDIDINENIVKSFLTKPHKVYNKEYNRYYYQFLGPLSGIIGYITVMEDAIKFLEMMWGFDSDGSEKYLIKYPVGSIVSLISKKSSDFLVLENIYDRSTSQFCIKYKIAEILSNVQTTIIRYGDVGTYKEKDICYSRDSRISDILN